MANKEWKAGRTIVRIAPKNIEIQKWSWKPTIIIFGGGSLFITLCLYGIWMVSQ